VRLAVEEPDTDNSSVITDTIGGIQIPGRTRGQQTVQVYQTVLSIPNKGVYIGVTRGVRSTHDHAEIIDGVCLGLRAPPSPKVFKSSH